MMMRRAFLGCLMAAACTAGATAQAQLRNKPDPTLDSLFERLAKAQAPAQAQQVAEAIRRRLGRSGSDTADLLVSRANGALMADDPALAIELLDRAIMLRPHWAEGWNSRALVFFALEDHTRAMADLVEVLRLEPRHYPAMMGLGAIMQQRGQIKAAYHLYQRAKIIYPLYDKTNEAIEKLIPQVEGLDL
jgi:tetratricopeptide (TPR) repeat protein